MSARSTLLSTLLIGLLAGAGIMQLLDGPSAGLGPVAVDVAGESAAAGTRTAAEAVDEPSPSTMAQAGSSPSGTIDYRSRAELEESLPRSIVNVLIDRNALLIEKVEPNAP